MRTHVHAHTSDELSPPKCFAHYIYIGFVIVSLTHQTCDWEISVCVYVCVVFYLCWPCRFIETK